MNIKKRYIASVILLICLISITGIAWSKMNSKPAHIETGIVDIEFDDGIGRGHRVFFLVEKSTSDQTRYRLLKKVWQRNRPAFTPTSKSAKIPKIIHQIWLGPKRPPGFFLKFRESWQKLHPDWEYRLWTDVDLATYDFELRDLFDLSDNYGEKSDILRAELLYKYGGVYVDTDFECLKPIDELVSKYDFFTGIEPPHEIRESSRVLFVSNALIGSVPGHPIIKRWKQIIRERWKKAEEVCFTSIESVLLRTFMSFGRAVEEKIESSEYVNVVFPSTYFFPISPDFIRKPIEPLTFFKKMLIAFDLRKDRPFSRVLPETLAVHHFACTWQKGTQEIMKEVQREIIRLKKEQNEIVRELSELKEKLSNEMQKNV